MNGEWDIDDLDSLTSSFRLTYAYFYWISRDPYLIDPTVKHGIQRNFWSGEFNRDRYADNLYHRIPPADRLRLASIHFASPGWIEILGDRSVMMLLGAAVTSWIVAADKAFELFRKIEDYFEQRKLKKIPHNLSLDEIDGAAIDEARSMCFEYGTSLGFSEDKIEGIIEIAGNPIAALRVLVAISTETRRVDQLQQAGKLSLPSQKRED